MTDLQIVRRDELREEIEQLEDRIAELTEFRSGRSFHESATGG